MVVKVQSGSFSSRLALPQAPILGNSEWLSIGHRRKCDLGVHFSAAEDFIVCVTIETSA